MKSILVLLVLLSVVCAQARSLKDSTNTADILVVTAPVLAERMVMYKDWRESQGFEVKIVTTNAVYRQFPSPQHFNSIKNFMDYVFANWHKAPDYLLLVGDYSLLPSFPIDAEPIAIGTAEVDNYYVIQEENSAYTLRIPVGRLPVTSSGQLLNVLEKIIAVENQQYRDLYGTDFLFLADDGSPDWHLDVFEQQIDYLVDLLPDDQRWQRIDIDSTSQHFGTRTDFLALLSSGALFVTYAGHSNQSLWAHEKMLTFADADSVCNENMPFFIVTTGCRGAALYNPDEVLVNRFLWKELVGAFGAVSATGIVYASDMDHVARGLFVEMFRDPTARLGDMFRNAINNTAMVGRSKEEMLITHFSFTLTGDPCLILPIRTQAEINHQHELPLAFELRQNYPNPFNPKTKIEFVLPADAIVDLTVFNLLGRPAKRLVSHQLLHSGFHSILFDATELGSGIYLYSLQAGDFRETRRMVLLK